jgi:TolB-like protein
MHHVFGSYALYPDRAELVGPEGSVRLEPKAFAVLRLLVENHDRVVSREEMIEAIWGGRFVSDAAVSTALKFARKAVGDDGAQQTMIRTMHGLGHRFVAPVERRVDATTVVQAVEPAQEQTDRRPTIAVLPFVQNAGEAVHVGDGLADEIISSLSRLRWLRVIARESTFRFRQDGIDLEGLRRVLGAGYALSGRVELVAGRLNVSVTLIETLSGSVVWSDRFNPALAELHLARQEITSAVIGALDLRISQAEAATARTKSTEMLDAWGAYHLGMSHFNRFNAHDNVIAAGLFERATVLDPGFATAFAAWSIARFQDAKLGYQTDFAAIAPDVRSLAERAVELDPYDPLASMAMGRVQSLEGNPEDGIFWYERSVRLSPNFAKGYFSQGVSDLLAGRNVQSCVDVDLSLGLSPLDPLLGPMLSIKAMSFLLEGNRALARDWSLQAVRSNQSHYIVIASTALICHLAGDAARAAHWTAVLLARRPDASVSMFQRALLFADLQTRAMIRRALVELGLPD